MYSHPVYTQQVVCTRTCNYLAVVAAVWLQTKFRKHCIYIYIIYIHHVLSESVLLSVLCGPHQCICVVYIAHSSSFGTTWYTSILLFTFTEDEDEMVVAILFWVHRLHLQYP